MSYFVQNTKITLTRGDTFIGKIEIKYPDGTPYNPIPGDQIRFAMKKEINDETPLILREIPIETMTLILNPEDTKHLEFGNYFYDIQLTKSNGDVDTFITKSILNLTEEVD